MQAVKGGNMRLRTSGLGLCSIALLLTCAEPALAEAVKLRGWFACEKCTASRVAKGDLRPSNPVCSRECIDKGSAEVFISEHGKELLKVRGYTSVKEDLGYHLEVSGHIDPVSKTLSIETVKRLAYEGASCSRPRNEQGNRGTGSGAR
jgi:hypothetical protein